MTTRSQSHRTDTKQSLSTSKEEEASLPAPPQPPAAQAPDVPTGFDPSARIGKRAVGWAALGSLAAEGATEVGSSTTFAEDFGAKRDPAPLSAALDCYAAWQRQSARAHAWSQFIATGNAASGNEAKRQLQLLQGAFESALLLDPTIAQRYPRLAAIFQAKSQPGRRAAVTRRAVKAAKAAPPGTTTK
jgi:hypothetical protein